jgi:hypothetical protein
VISRGAGAAEAIEAAFDAGRETEGTLVLTSRRLIYAHGAEQEEDLMVGETAPLLREGRRRLIYSDVEDLESIAPDPANLSISIDSVLSAVGHRGVMTPKLEVRWSEGGRERVAVFVQQITGSSRRKNLNDWAPVIERLKAGQQKIAELPALPGRDSLEGRIVTILSDMQEKGLFTIEGEVEEQFNTELDPDEIEQACERLASQGLIERTNREGEDPFYRKVSPLGSDDLSA